MFKIYFSMIMLLVINFLFMLQSYIVYLGGHDQTPEDASLVSERRADAHHELLRTVLKR